MYKNAFEELKAATEYGGKGISQQIKMLQSEGVTRDETEPFRLYLLKPENYLFDELMTARGADYNANKDEIDIYKYFVNMLTGIDETPICFNAAHGWFMQVKPHITTEIKTKSAFKKALTAAAKDDPWILQGAAALLTRAAIYCETNSLKDVIKTWDAAFDMWNKFFAAADVSTSQCYILEKDAKKKEMCSAAWNNFRTRLAQDIYDRAFEYLNEKNGASFNVLIQALELSYILQAAPELYDRALAEAQSRTMSTIEECVEINELITFWKTLPSNYQSKSKVIAAALRVMTKEAANIGKGLGNANALIQFWNLSRICSHKDTNDLDIAPEMKNFYNSVGITALDFWNDIKSPDRAKNLDIIETISIVLPDGHFIANSSDGPFTAKKMRTSLGIEKLNPKIEKFIDSSPKDSATVTFYKDILNDVNSEKAKGNTEINKLFEDLCIMKVIQCSNEVVTSNNTNAKELALLICSNLPPDSKFPISENQFISLDEIKGYINNAGAISKIMRIQELIDKFTKGKPTDSATKNAYSKLFLEIKEANDNTLNDVFKTICINKVLECLTVVAAGNDFYNNAKTLGKEVCGDLPYGTLFPISDGFTVSKSDMMNIFNGNVSISTSPVKGPVKEKLYFNFGIFVGYVIFWSILPLIICLFHWIPGKEFATWLKVVGIIYAVITGIISILMGFVYDKNGKLRF